MNKIKWRDKAKEDGNWLSLLQEQISDMLGWVVSSERWKDYLKGLEYDEGFGCPCPVWQDNWQPVPPARRNVCRKELQKPQEQ